MIEFIVQAQVLKENKFTFFLDMNIYHGRSGHPSLKSELHLPATMYLEKKA